MIIATKPGTSEPGARTPSGARTLARRAFVTIGSWLLILLGLVLGLAGALLAFVLTALVSSSPLLLVLSALLVQVAVTAGVARLAARNIAPARPARLAVGVGIAAMLCTSVIAGLVFFRPLTSSAEQANTSPPAGAAYWDMPTGSRIAYLKVPANAVGEGERPAPVIRVHGGPGAYALANASFMPFYRELAREGFDVYIYDQVGGGLSARLSDPQEYTLDRHVRDLEAIRQRIGAEQVILLADSWGAVVASRYMAVHPDRVTRIVFTSPAPIDTSEWRNEPWQDITARLDEGQKQQIDAFESQPRFIALVLLSRINVQAAYNFTSDAEMDGYFDAWTAKMLPGMVCDPSTYRAEDVPHGFGFWANVMTGSDASLHGKGQRAALATNRTPALILKGECDHIKWGVAHQYKTTLPNSTLLYIPKAGHVIYFDRPDIFSEVVRAFLLDRPLPLKPYEGTAPPE